MIVITIGGKMVQDQPLSMPAGINFFEMTTGAAKYGYGKFLLKREDYDALVGNAGDESAQTSDPCGGSGGSGGGSGGSGSGGDCVGPFVLLMQDDADANQRVQFNVIIAGAIPYSTPVSSHDDTTKDMSAVLVYDMRCKQYDPKGATYNVQVQDFAFTFDNQVIFYPASLNASAEYTWDQVVADFGMIVQATLPAWKPRNLIWDGVSLARIKDDIAGQLFMVMGWNWTTEVSTAYAPTFMEAVNSTLIGQIEPRRIAGHPTGRDNCRLPGRFEVTFKTVGGGDQADPDSRTYTNIQFPGNGDANASCALHVGEYIGTYRSGTLLNQGELNSVACDIAARAWAFISAPIDEYQFAGIWPFFPDGAIRKIRWDNRPSPYGSKTSLSINNDKDYRPLDEFQHVTELQGDMKVGGLGDVNSSISQSTRSYVWKRNVRLLFPVKLEKTSGDGGSSTTMPTWQYDVLNLDEEVLVRNAQPLWARAIGFFNQAVRGTAFWDTDGRCVLWQADEIEPAQICMSGSGT